MYNALNNKNYSNNYDIIMTMIVSLYLMCFVFLRKNFTEAMPSSVKKKINKYTIYYIHIYNTLYVLIIR